MHITKQIRMNEGQPGTSTHIHLVDVAAFKQLLGLVLAQLFFNPVELNLI